MPEDIVLKYDADDSVLPWIVPVGEGQDPADVGKAFPGWVQVEGANPEEIRADLAAAEQARSAAVDAAPTVPAEPATPDPAPAAVTTPEGN